MKKQKKNKSNLKVKIISGAWKGRNISFLEKRDLRPTKNQIRETLFNWLQNDVKNSVCIDLFAGSGALGFEAASRGAKQVFMVDNDIDIINSLNSQKIKFEASNVDLIHANAEEYIEGHHDEVDIIFLDPPFSKNIINNIFPKLNMLKKLSNKCKIYIELPYCKNPENNIDIPPNWELIKSDKLGDVAYLLFQYKNTVV